MTAKEVLAELKKTGTAQNHKVYARHGIGENMFGVSFADLGKLKKKSKWIMNWRSSFGRAGNHDAQVLATMIVEPAQLDDRLLESWVDDLSNLRDRWHVLENRQSVNVGPQENGEVDEVRG